MAVPNIARRMALPSETQRDQSPRISRTPSVVSATVAVHAIRGITADGMNEFTCAAYCWNLANEPQSNVTCHSPYRTASAERYTVQSAMREERTASVSQLISCN